jgi:anti-sigma factor RsiW
MKTPDDQLLGRWLDGELTPEEHARFESMMAADPALREEAQSMKKIGEAIRSHVTLEREVPHADFFNSQIQECIAAEHQAEQRAKTGTRAAATWLDWLRAPWAYAAAAAVLAVGFFLLQQPKAAGARTQILSLYAPSSTVKATASYNADAEATVLMIDGLEAIPADRNVAGFNVHHSENDSQMATTTLFDDRGDVLLVMSKDAASRPLVIGGGL